MKKSFARAAIMLLTILTLIPLCSMYTFAASTAQGYSSKKNDLCEVIDDAGIFDDDPDTLDELTKLVRETSKELELYICIYLSGIPRSDYNTDVFADEKYDSIFGKDTDGVLYYMDMSGQYSPYDRISTAGKAMLLYPDDTITDEMLPVIFRHLPASGEPNDPHKIKDGIRTICSVLKTYGDEEPGFFDYAYDSYTRKYIYYQSGKTVVSSFKPPAIFLKGALISLPIAVLVAIAVYFSVKSHYKFKVSCNPSVYVSREESHFTRQDDTFLRAHTSKIKIETSSGGGHGGGHSGGHGGGGGSHGGGGGHR